MRAEVVGAPAGSDMDKIYDSIIFLWRIVQKFTAHTNATIWVIVHYLTNLKDVVTNVDLDIGKFNTNINTKLGSY
jgi:hypothetical protein